MKPTLRKNIFLFIALIVILLTIVSTSLVVTTYSRYVSSKIDDEKGTVAQFKISEVLENGGMEQVLNISLIPGDNITENIIVTNDGDVLVRYTITITNVTNNLPLNFVGDEDLISPHTNKTCQIKISWPKESNNPDFSGKVDIIKISIIAEQVVEG